MTRMPQTDQVRGASGRGAHSGYEALATGLGVFSLGLGLTELLAPRAFCRAFGLKGQKALVMAYGVREAMTGIAVLMSHDPTPWIWGRVAGDAMDLATLAAAASLDNEEQKRNVGVALAAVAGIMALDVICAVGLTAAKRLSPAGTFDYSDRTGFPRPPAAMRGAAEFQLPADYRVPNPLRPWKDGRPVSGTSAMNSASTP